MGWSKEKIVDKIHTAAERYQRLNPQQFKQLQFALERTSPDLAFDALYSIFLDTSRPDLCFMDQEYAGRLLLAVTPPCPLDPMEAIRSVLFNYDLSIEQLPQYFEALYGREAVVAMLEGLAKEHLTEREAISLQTFGFWIGGRAQARALQDA